MVRAVLKDGVIQPVDPLPPNWQDGRELWVEEAQESEQDDAFIERWYRDLEAMVAANDTKEAEHFQAMLAEVRHRDRELARREAGLSP